MLASLALSNALYSPLVIITPGVPSPSARRELDKFICELIYKVTCIFCIFKRQNIVKYAFDA